LLADRIARRIIDVTPSFAYNVTCGRHVITSAILHETSPLCCISPPTLPNSDVPEHSNIRVILLE